MKPSSQPSKIPSKFFNSCAFLFVGCLSLSGVSSAAPSVTLSKKSGPPTSQILVSGRGFEPNVGVDIYFDTKDEALVVTNSRGDFKASKAYAPRSARPGQHWVTVLERNNDKGAQKPFLVQTDWPQFRFESDGARLNPYENVLSPRNVGNLAVKWIFKTGSSVVSAPTVVNGVVYIGSNDDNVYALDAHTGKKLWSYTTGAEIYSAPVSAHGVIYVGSNDGNVYALKAATGKKLWSYYTGGGESVPAVQNGVVYVGSAKESGDNVFALNAQTGALIWSFAARFSVYSSPVVVDGVLYIMSLDYNLYALDASSGAKLWNFSTEGYAYASPMVANGVVYFDGIPGSVFGVNAKTGSLLWQFVAGGTWGEFSPAVADGVVYVASDGGYAYALDGLTGAELWSYSPIGFVSLAAPVLANGVMYFGTWDNNLYALSMNRGERLWSYTTGGYIEGSPTVANGIVYAGSDDGNVYAFGLPERDEPIQQARRPPQLKSLHPDLTLVPCTPLAASPSPKGTATGGVKVSHDSA
jgi:outer membrane protein assembly factor BamB